MRAEDIPFIRYAQKDNDKALFKSKSEALLCGKRYVRFPKKYFRLVKIRLYRPFAVAKEEMSAWALQWRYEPSKYLKVGDIRGYYDCD